MDVSFGPQDFSNFLSNQTAQTAEMAIMDYFSKMLHRRQKLLMELQWPVNHFFYYLPLLFFYYVVDWTT